MRIIDMRPEITPFDDGGLTGGKKTWIGKWSYEDITVAIAPMMKTARTRYIYHHEALMGRYQQVRVGVKTIDHDRGEIEEVWSEWTFKPMSLGHGSVSDQGGMNELMSFTGKWRNGFQRYQSYGYYYARDIKGGGPRIINLDTNEVEID